MGSELWEDKFGSLFGLVKGFIWELRKVKLYGDNPSVQQTQSQIALRCLGGETPRVHNYCVCSFVNSSAHCFGCVVYGPSAMAAS